MPRMLTRAASAIRHLFLASAASSLHRDASSRDRRSWRAGRRLPSRVQRPLSLRGCAAFLLLLGVTWLAQPTLAQDPAAERLYREASRMEDAGDQEGALEELLLLVQQFPRDRLAPQALLQAVELRAGRGDVAGAHSVLKRLLDDYPRSQEAAAGFVLQGRLRHEEAQSTADLDEARASWRRVPLLYGKETFPNLPSRSEAQVRSGEMSLLLGDPATAASEFLAVVEDEPVNRWTDRARVGLAWSWIQLQRWQAAAEVLRHVSVEDAPGTSGLDAAMAKRARDETAQLLALMQRMHLRPQIGESPWAEVSRFPQGGNPLRQPEGVAAGADGRSLVTDGKSKSVLMLDAKGRLTESATLEDMRRPAWSEGRWPYVVTDEEIRLPFQGERNRFLEPRPDRERQLDNMQAAERGVFGKWYVLAKGWKSVLAFETSRRGRELLGKDRPAFVDMAQDAQGRIYLLDSKSKQVQRLDRDGNYDGVVLQGNWRRPQALALDPLGRIYVLDRADNTLQIYTADGRPLWTLGPTFAGGIELRSAVDVAVDGGGRIFIADTKLPFVVVLE